ncbi:MAG: gliding motility-associated C-terminal domain-containing protein [Ferruginibacter sp.]
MNLKNSSVLHSKKGIQFFVACLLLMLTGFSSFAQAPTNDDPCAAITLTPATTCTYQSFTTLNATTSTGFPAPGCANYQGGDVWFQVTVPAGGALIFDSQVGSGTGNNITDGGMAIYSGDCNTMTLIECDDDDSPNGNMPLINRTGLTPGSTIFVRFWNYGTATNGGNFGICVRTPPPPPGNDNPCNATPLQVNQNGVCNYEQFTNEGATATTGVPAPGCASYNGGDVWFTVTVPAGGSLIFDTQSGVITDGGMAIYSGTCSALTLIECDDDDSPNGLMPMIVRTGLTPGSTIWIRVWEYGGDNNGTFGICVKTPPPPPANDNPCTATLITVDPNGGCNYQQYTNEGATASAGVPAPGCASYNGADVWFKVVVPCSGNLTFNTNTGVVTDGGMAIYRGSCGSLTLIECDDDDSENGAMPKIVRTGLTVGDTIWIRFWEYGGDNNGTFRLCVSSPLPPITLPALPPSPTCALAQPFCTSVIPYTMPNVSGGSSTGGGGVFGCLATTPNPTYYTLQIQNSGPIQLTISQVNTAGTPIDVDFVIWGPFTSASACTGISASNIVSCSYSSNAVEIIDIPNAVAGQFYILLVTNFQGGAGQITYQQTGGTGSSSCCSMSATNSGPYFCQGGGSFVNFTGSTVANATYQWVGPNCFTSTLQNPSQVPVPSAPGQYIYTVTAYTPTGQVCSDTTIVTVLARPSIGADTSLKICSGSTVNLTTLYTTTGLTSSWTLGGAAVQNPAAVNVSGIYRLIAANITGCNDTAFVNLTVDTVRLETSVAQIICTRTGRITVSPTTGIAPYQYSISTNPGVFQTSNEFIAPEGTYTVTVKDSLGCTASRQVTVTIIPEITVNAGQDVSVVAGDAAQLLATTSAPPSSITWTPATGLNATNILNPIARPATTTTYTISVTNSQGCIAEDDIVVTVIPYCIRVKNAFTPNGDGINDTWEVYNSFDCLSNVTINVFNRYGNLVYRDVKYANNWRGTYNGKPVPDGTYYAVVDFTFITGKKVTIKTDLTILR